MKLILDDNQLNQAPENLLRRAGYSFFIDPKTEKESFVRPLNRGYYPRFHLYLSRQGNEIILNLHLDQKQASYPGEHAHNAEYESEIVVEEMERIKNLVTHNSQPVTRNADPGGAEQRAAQNINSGTGQDILDKIRPKQFKAGAGKPEKKSWWRKLFS